MTNPLNKKNHIKGAYYTEKKLSNAGVSKNYNLNKIKYIIIDAILLYIPDAYNIIVGRRFYYFESPKEPTRGQLIAIGSYISLKSGLYKNLREYPSKSGKHPPTRVLFKIISKNYNP